MSIFEVAQLLVAVAVLLIALFSGQIRAGFWIVAIVLDLAVSTNWWTHGLPNGDVFTAGCDFALCIMIYVFAADQWERWLFRLYTLSFLISTIDLGASIWAPEWIDHDTYSIALEAVNYAAFLLIGGVSGFAFNDHFDHSAFDPWIRLFVSRGLGRSVVDKDRR